MVETSARLSQLEHKVRILTHLTEVSAALNSQMELQPLLAYIMDVAVEITASEAASVLLWNKTKGELFFAASTTLDSDNNLIGLPVPMDSIAGQIFTQNSHVQVDDAFSDPRIYRKVDSEIDFVTRNLLGVPMTYKGNVIGVLEVINKREGGWTEDDLNHIGILAAQAAVALRGAQFVGELRRMNEELSELDKLKNDFIAIASHELRTPLGVIMGYASFLQESEEQDTQDHATKVLDSALRLRKIIDDMISLRYLKQKQSDLHQEPIHLGELLGHLHQELQTHLDTSKHHFSIEACPDCRVNIDLARISMAMMNILSNAFSFTPAGGSIRILSEATPRHVLLRVQDTGRGLDAEQLERIFEEFYQVEDHMTRHHGGLGIGLSITRAIIGAHEGKVWAESAGLGQGSTFVVQLPKLD